MLSIQGYVNRITKDGAATDGYMLNKYDGSLMASNNSATITQTESQDLLTFIQGQKTSITLFGVNYKLLRTTKNGSVFDLTVMVIYIEDGF